MTPRNFLLWGGLVMAIVGLFGLIHVLGPTTDLSIFSSVFWLDSSEGWIMLVVGVLSMLISAFVHQIERGVSLLIGIAALLVAIVSLFTHQLGNINVERPVATIVYLAIAVLAIWASFTPEPLKQVREAH